MTVGPIAAGAPMRAIEAISETGRMPTVATVQDAAYHGPANDFSEMLGAAISGVAHQLRKAEVVSMAGIKGVASTQDVVEQVMAAEQSLQTTIAIRDKIVAAYLEISRMQI